ncbi:MAG: hypothetical protein PW789_00375 [Edaphobacter sp.]|uniref:hypothetical protein n=1 Tax=Edaphobacter sp. TaxID=1934404 RepID=UPI00239515DF|nr:hypothetical protein [Edaphobacter sp.]MDE1175047.1 hypothetical protein [Edaphobacter sp.]
MSFALAHGTNRIGDFFVSRSKRSDLFSVTIYGEDDLAIRMDARMKHEMSSSTMTILIDISPAPAIAEAIIDICTQAGQSRQ